jgi:hypothetical protein
VPDKTSMRWVSAYWLLSIYTTKPLITRALRLKSARCHGRKATQPGGNPHLEIGVMRLCPAPGRNAITSKPPRVEGQNGH